MATTVITSSKQVTLCDKCMGACYDPNNSKQQANARKMFGVTPNDCVSDSYGNNRCPYAPK